MDALIYRAGSEKFAALGADKDEVAAAFYSVYLTRENACPGGFSRIGSTAGDDARLCAGLCGWAFGTWSARRVAQGGGRLRYGWTDCLSWAEGCRCHRWIAGEAAVGHSMTARGDGKDPSAPMPGQSRWHHLYNTRRWQRIARAQLAAEPLCAFCAARGLVVPATVVDHVEPHHGDRNKFWFGKLQSLCATCHGRDKRSEERKGFRPDIGPDGWPTDPRHPANRR